jgi:DNA ligase-associated metallophosphoesterase
MSALTAPPTPAFAASPCGGLAAPLAGAEVVMRASGALWLPNARALLAADLHLEKGSAYARRGQMLPPYDTHDTISRLESEIAALDPVIVALLGDTFHDSGAEGRLCADEASRLSAVARGRTLVWIVGNHDVDGPKALPGEVVDTLSLAGRMLGHEPTPGPSPGEIAGHLHPAARVAAPRGTIRRRCFVTDGSRMILPAFGAFAGGLNVRDRAFAGLFVRPPLVGALATNRVRAIGWKRCVGD